MAQRLTWLKEAPFTYRFLLDKPTPSLVAENNLHQDIVFLNATFSGAEKGLGEKMLIWLKYAHKNFPDAKLLGKADDDVYVCDWTISHIQENYHPRLYYGYSHVYWYVFCEWTNCIGQIYIM